eukprot:177937_1
MKNTFLLQTRSLLHYSIPIGVKQLLKCQSACKSSKPINDHNTTETYKRINVRKSNLEYLGYDSVVSPLRSPRYLQMRKQILHCKSSSEIMNILSKSNDVNDTVYNAAIKCCGQLADWRGCKQIMNIIPPTKLTSVTFGTLFTALASNVDKPHTEADVFINKMREYNIKMTVITFNALLNGCKKIVYLNRAERLWADFFSEFDEKPNMISYIIMMDIYAINGQSDKTKAMFDDMISNKITPDVVCYNILIKAYIKAGHIDCALQIKYQAENAGIQLIMQSYVPIIAYYLKDNAHHDPYKALNLIMKVESLELNETGWDIVYNLKMSVYLVLLKSETDKVKYFSLINWMLSQRSCKGLSKYTKRNAHILLDSFLYFYGNDFDNDELLQLFKDLCKENFIGYVTWNFVYKKWEINLHGFSYELIDFVMYYVMKYDMKKWLNENNGDVIVVCGKRKSIDNDRKYAKGIMQHVMELCKKWEIKCKINPINAGQILLSKTDIEQKIKVLDKKSQII